MGVWVFGAVNTLLGATVFAELGAMIPLSGGPYPIARRALGDYAGFLVGYTQWALDAAANAALLLLVGEYAYVLIPALAGHAVSVAFATLVIMMLLNWRGVGQSGRIQVITTVAKTLALGAVVIVGFLTPATTGPMSADTLPMPHGIGLIGAWILAMQAVIFSFDSYYAPIFFGEELKDPGREIPRAIFRGLIVIIPMYLLLNVAFLRVVPIAKMANDSFVGGTAAQVLFGAHGDQIIRMIVIVSVLGTINALILTTARVLLAMSRDGLFAHQAARINAGGTPTTSLLLSGIVTGTFLLSGTFGEVLGVVALLMAVNYMLMFISLIVLRKREPDTPRPYRAWGYPWTTAIAILVGVAFIVGVALADPRNSAIAFAILLISYPLFHATRRLLQSKR
jgi:APA family basic amino acid/polyamine antiporter